MSKSKEFSKKTLENLGYYVYVYSDPDTKVPFYIGKGKGNRCFDHLNDAHSSKKVAKIQDLERLDEIIKEICQKDKKPEQ